MNPQMETVYCFDCQQYLPANQFAGRALSKNKKQPRCYSCFSRRSKSWKSKKKHEDLKANGQLLLFEVY